MRKFTIFLSAALGILFLQGCTTQKAMDEKVTLSYMLEKNSSVDAVAGSMNDTKFKYELSERTGIDVEYIYPKYDIQDEIMVTMASENLPDIIEFDWQKYVGGPGKAIENEIILPLNDVIKLYSPNLYQYFENHPEERMVCTIDSGELYAYPSIANNIRFQERSGPVARQDILEKYGLSFPHTLEEWEKTLECLKNNKIDTPLTVGIEDFADGFITGAFNLCSGFYVDRGVVKFGEYETGYYDFLVLLNRWYHLGYIDKNFAALSTETKIEKMQSGKTVITYIDAGNSMEMLLREKDENRKIAAVKYPVLKDTDTIRFGRIKKSIGVAAITAKCKNIPAAAKFLDYGYSESGSMIYNFGTENQSYIMVDGRPQYTELIIANEQYPLSAIITDYTRADSTGPFITSNEIESQYFRQKEQKEALNLWRSNSPEETQLPNLSFDSTEGDTIAHYKSGIEKYAKEMTVKFIMGIEPLSSFENYRWELSKRGMEEILHVYQDAYDRYLKRER